MHFDAEPVLREGASQLIAGVPARRAMSRSGNPRNFDQAEAGNNILIGKCEAQPANGVQGQKHAGLCSPPTQATDIDIEADVVEVIKVFAQRFDKCAPFDHLATLAEQECQHPLFRSRQAKTVSQPIAQYPAAFNKRPFRCRLLRGDRFLRKPLIERKHRCSKLAWLEGFDKIGVGALLKSIDPVGRRSVSCRNYNSDRSSRPQMTGHRQAVFSFEANVDDHDVRRLGRIGPVQRRGVLKPINVQAQPG